MDRITFLLPVNYRMKRWYDLFLGKGDDHPDGFYESNSVDVPDLDDAAFESSHTMNTLTLPEDVLPFSRGIHKMIIRLDYEIMLGEVEKLREKSNELSEHTRLLLFGQPGQGTYIDHD